MTTIDDLRAALRAAPPKEHAVNLELVRLRAAVAIVTRSVERDVELLFIRRAAYENDPWSGDIAFPGGRIDKRDETPRDTAERETREEVGLDLRQAEWLGQLDDVAGGNGQVVVSGHVYAVSGPVNLALNHEVAAAGWVRVATLAERERQGLKKFRYEERDIEMPAIRVFDDDSPHLWGMTYRFVESFMRVIGRSIPVMPWRDSD